MKTFQTRVLKWYAANKRDLPWRQTDDPYHILVSEVMLQQTQVDRVIPKYQAFLAAFPTIEHLAAAKTSNVISLWSGLGYNRRAVYLQKAAQEIVARGGNVPDAEEALQQLSGVGVYTSRAVLCFAFHRDVPVIDTNIRRVFSRYFFEGKGSVEEIDARVARSVPRGNGTAWNNALMDFGSILCTAAAPACGVCPVNSTCAACKVGNQERYLRIASPQKKFKDSRRQYRGMVLRMLKDAPEQGIVVQMLQQGMKKSKKFIDSIIDELEKDSLVVRKKEYVSLP